MKYHIPCEASNFFPRSNHDPRACVLWKQLVPHSFRTAYKTGPSLCSPTRVWFDLSRYVKMNGDNQSKRLTHFPVFLWLYHRLLKRRVMEFQYHNLDGPRLLILVLKTTPCPNLMSPIIQQPICSITNHTRAVFLHILCRLVAIFDFIQQFILCVGCNSWISIQAITSSQPKSRPIPLCLYQLRCPEWLNLPRRRVERLPEITSITPKKSWTPSWRNIQREDG